MKIDAVPNVVRSRRLAIRSVLITLTLALALRAAPSHAQPADHGGVWFAAGLATRGTSTINTTFETPLLFGLQGSGQGSQAVTVEGSTGAAFEVGGQWFPAPKAGLEIWLSKDSSDDVTSSDYQTTLIYTSLLPPDYIPREFQYERTTPMDVATTIRRVTLGVNGAFRPVTSSRASWVVSGGLAWVRVTGEAAPLGFTSFLLGGHSTLLPNEYKLTTEFEPASAWRVNVGTTFDAKLAAHLAFTAGARVVIGGDQDLRLRVVEVDRTLAGYSPPSNAEIESALADSVVQVPTASFRILAGLKALF